MGSERKREELNARVKRMIREAEERGASPETIVEICYHHDRLERQLMTPRELAIERIELHRDAQLRELYASYESTLDEAYKEYIDDLRYASEVQPKVMGNSPRFERCARSERAHVHFRNEEKVNTIRDILHQRRALIEKQFQESFDLLHKED